MSLRTLILALLGLCLTAAAIAAPLDQRDVHVIDEDTVRLMDHKPDVRLGRDVGDILIEEKLAAPFRCGAVRCPATPRPWCVGATP